MEIEEDSIPDWRVHALETGNYLNLSTFDKVISSVESTQSPLSNIEDINRDNTMNTIDSYFEYEMNIS